MIDATEPDGDEKRYVRRLQENESGAYDRLMQSYHSYLFRMANRMIGDSGEAADIVQDILLKVFRNIRSFRGDAALRSWIFRIALSEILNRRRRWKRKQRFPTVSLDDLHISDPGATPDRVLESKEMGTAIRSALSAISAHHRAILILRDIDECSYIEIAEAGGIAVGTVKSRLARARTAMKASLLQHVPIQGE